MGFASGTEYGRYQWAGRTLAHAIFAGILSLAAGLASVGNGMDTHGILLKATVEFVVCLAETFVPRNAILLKTVPSELLSCLAWIQNLPDLVSLLDNHGSVTCRFICRVRIHMGVGFIAQCYLRDGTSQATLSTPFYSVVAKMFHFCTMHSNMLFGK